MSESKTLKKTKKQGPLRTGILVPFVLIVLVISLFNIFFLDITIKKTITFIGEKVNGAQVDVDSVSTSFKELKISVKKIEFTDKNNPQLNKIVIGEFRFQMLWDALLRGKFVIDRAELADISINVPRQSKGYVLPIAPANSEDSQAAQVFLDKTKKEFQGNVLGDIAGMLSGQNSNNPIQISESELASTQAIEQVKQEISAKQNQMELKLKDIPNAEKLGQLQNRLNTIPWNDLGNPSKASKALKEIEQLKKDIEATNKAIKNANNAVKDNMASINSSYAKVQNAVNQDMANITSRMKLPSLDPKQISKLIFGDEFLQKTEELMRYKELAKKYMPASKATKETVERPARGEGKNYHFGKPKSYPLFWLKLAKINSQNEQGFVKGEIQNITNDQKSIGKISTARIEADFPQMDYRNIIAKMELDHRELLSLRLESEIGSFPIENKALSDTADIKFILKKASTQTQIKAIATAKKIDLKLDNKFKNIDYVTAAKSPQMDEILKTVANKTPLLSLNAKASGAWNNIQFDIQSNLAQAIQKATQSLLQEKIDAAKAKVKTDIDSKIAHQKKAIDDQINNLKSTYTNQLKAVETKMAQLKNDLNRKKSQAESKAKKGALKGIKL